MSEDSALAKKYKNVKFMNVPFEIGNFSPLTSPFYLCIYFYFIKPKGGGF